MKRPGTGCRSCGAARFEREKLCGQVEVDGFSIGGQKSGPRGRGAHGKTIIAVALER